MKDEIIHKLLISSNDEDRILGVSYLGQRSRDEIIYFMAKYGVAVYDSSGDMFISKNTIKSPNTALKSRFKVKLDFGYIVAHDYFIYLIYKNFIGTNYTEI